MIKYLPQIIQLTNEWIGISSASTISEIASPIAKSGYQKGKQAVDYIDVKSGFAERRLAKQQSINASQSKQLFQKGFSGEQRKKTQISLARRAKRIDKIQNKINSFKKK
jgi:hypothetical protein